VIVKVVQSAALGVALCGFWLLTSTAWTLFAGGVLVVVLMELHDARKDGD
jgi:hypothetical protein